MDVSGVGSVNPTLTPVRGLSRGGAKARTEAFYFGSLRSVVRSLRTTEPTARLLIQRCVPLHHRRGSVCRKRNSKSDTGSATIPGGGAPLGDGGASLRDCGATLRGAILQGGGATLWGGGAKVWDGGATLGGGMVSDRYSHTRICFPILGVLNFCLIAGLIFPTVFIAVDARIQSFSNRSFPVSVYIS